jgi:hypothetical protein
MLSQEFARSTQFPQPKLTDERFYILQMDLNWIKIACLLSNYSLLVSYFFLPPPPSLLPPLFI